MNDDPLQDRETELGVIYRERGDARLRVLGADMGGAGRRVRIAIDRPVAPGDEVHGEVRWSEQARFALRLSELDECIATLARARAWMVEMDV